MPRQANHAQAEPAQIKDIAFKRNSLRERCIQIVLQGPVIRHHPFALRGVQYPLPLARRRIDRQEGQVGKTNLHGLPQAQRAQRVVVMGMA